jgi:malate dehydrogenase (oxaloacetate-decarboxylating)(NADP+)
MESGVAGIEFDVEEYKEKLESRLGKAREFMRNVINRAKQAPKRVVFPEGRNEKVLRAAHIILEEGIARPVLLGNETAIRRKAKKLGMSFNGLTVVDPASSGDFLPYVEEFYKLRQRKGVTLEEARALMRNSTVYGAMMVRQGDADALVAGINQHYPETIRPALQIIGMRNDVARVMGLFILILKDRVFIFADTTVNIEPTAEELADIAICSSRVARRFHIKPRIAMISFSNFGSAKHPFVDKVQKATEIVKQRAPELMVDGEMQADTAVTPDLLAEHFSFSTLEGRANVLIFPELQSANVAYKLVHRLAGAEAIGPILVGMRKPVHVLQHGMEVKDIVNMTAIAVVDAQETGESNEADRQVPRNTGGATVFRAVAGTS